MLLLFDDSPRNNTLRLPRVTALWTAAQSSGAATTRHSAHEGGPILSQRAAGGQLRLRILPVHDKRENRQLKVSSDRRMSGAGRRSTAELFAERKKMSAHAGCTHLKLGSFGNMSVSMNNMYSYVRLKKSEIIPLGFRLRPQEQYCKVICKYYCLSGTCISGFVLEVRTPRKTFGASETVQVLFVGILCNQMNASWLIDSIHLIDFAHQYIRYDLHP